MKFFLFQILLQNQNQKIYYTAKTIKNIISRQNQIENIFNI